VLLELRYEFRRAQVGAIREVAGATLAHEAALSASLSAFFTALRDTDLQPIAISPAQGLAPQTLDAEACSSIVTTIAAEVRKRQMADIGGGEFGDRKRQMLRELVELDGPEMLGALGKGTNENSHSDAIGWALDPRRATALAPPTLAALGRLLDAQSSKVRRTSRRARPIAPQSWTAIMEKAGKGGTVSVRREVRLDRWGAPPEIANCRLDLLLSGPDWALVIENKVYSTEHDEQTVTYWNWLIEYAPFDIVGGVFLSPARLPPRCEAFQAISYAELLGCILEGAVAGPLPRSERAVLACYVKTLRAHVLRREVGYVLGEGDSHERAL
jgi:hypothetical protein